MPSYFRKMINFASQHSSSSANSTPKQSPTDTPSYFYSPAQVPLPSPPQSPPSLPQYQYGPATPKVISSELKSSWNSSPRSGWDGKSRQAALDAMQNNSHGYQYPAKADRSVCSQPPSRSSSVSSFGTVSSSSSSSSLSSLKSSCGQRKLSSAMKGSPKSSPMMPLKSKCHVSFSNPRKPQAVHMHPLFALGRSGKPAAPIQYDVSATPSTNNTMDYLNKRIPMCTLLEPATEPPTRGKLTLTSDEFPWPVVIHASGNSAPVDATGRPIVPPASPSQGKGELSPFSSPALRSATSSSCSLPRKQEKKFYIDASSDSDDEDDDDSDDEGNSDAFVSNLDVLCALHSTLARGICQDEWDQLGEGDSPEQRRIARAYRRRCRETGDDLTEGVKRIDFLKNKTVLVGIQSKRKGDPSSRDGVFGKLVFAEGR